MRNFENVQQNTTHNKTNLKVRTKFKNLSDYFENCDQETDNRNVVSKSQSSSSINSQDSSGSKTEDKGMASYSSYRTYLDSYGKHKFSSVKPPAVENNNKTVKSEIYIEVNKDQLNPSIDKTPTINGNEINFVVNLNGNKLNKDNHNNIRNKFDIKPINNVNRCYYPPQNNINGNNKTCLANKVINEKNNYAPNEFVTINPGINKKHERMINNQSNQGGQTQEFNFVIKSMHDNQTKPNIVLPKPVSPQIAYVAPRLSPIVAQTQTNAAIPKPPVFPSAYTTPAKPIVAQTQTNAAISKPHTCLSANTISGRPIVAQTNAAISKPYTCLSANTISGRPIVAQTQTNAALSKPHTCLSANTISGRPIVAQTQTNAALSKPHTCLSANTISGRPIVAETQTNAALSKPYTCLSANTISGRPIVAQTQTNATIPKPPSFPSAYTIPARSSPIFAQTHTNHPTFAILNPPTFAIPNPPTFPGSATIPPPPKQPDFATHTPQMHSSNTLPHKPRNNAPKDQLSEAKNSIIDEIKRKMNNQETIEPKSKAPYVPQNNYSITKKFANPPPLAQTLAPTPVQTLPRNWRTQSTPIKRNNSSALHSINKLSNAEADPVTRVDVGDEVDVSKRDPNVKKLVYNTYRGLLGAYNNKANDMISTLPRNMVIQDRGVDKQINDMAINGGSVHQINGRTNPKDFEEL